MFCTGCGNRLEDGVRFCNRCGASTETNMSPMSAPAYTPPTFSPAKPSKNLHIIAFVVLGVVAFVIVFAMVLTNSAGSGGIPNGRFVSTGRATMGSRDSIGEPHPNSPPGEFAFEFRGNQVTWTPYLMGVPFLPITSNYTFRNGILSFTNRAGGILEFPLVVVDSDTLMIDTTGVGMFWHEYRRER